MVGCICKKKYTSLCKYTRNSELFEFSKKRQIIENFIVFVIVCEKIWCLRKFINSFHNY